MVRYQTLVSQYLILCVVCAQVYTWWQSNNRDKYPSSLFVTVTSVSPPKVKPVLYPQLAMKDVSDAQSDSQKHSYARTSTAVSLPKWARLAAQSCKIPNEKMFETETSENGCFYVAFSSDGKYLACVHSEEYSYPVVVYEVNPPNEINYCREQGNQGNWIVSLDLYE